MRRTCSSPRGSCSRTRRCRCSGRRRTGEEEAAAAKKKKKKREIYQCFTILEVIRQPFLVPNSLVTRQNVNDFSYSWLPLEPRTVTRTVFSPCDTSRRRDGRERERE